MTSVLTAHSVGPSVTVQDCGRAGFLAFGLSRGGAADQLALAEGAALLGQSTELPALEMAGFGGDFSVSEDTRIALTGAPMRVAIDGAPLVWNASHVLMKGARLSIGAVESGTYGYVHFGGGLAEPAVLDAQSAHLAAGLGEALTPGRTLALAGERHGDMARMTLPVQNRFDGGTIRLVSSLQTDLFSKPEIQRFEETVFKRDTRGNRMGVRLVPPDAGFGISGGLSILSEVIVPGDVQITGDGSPFILLNECQTTGGYPRIGSVLPCDLPKVVQAQPGAALSFRFVSLDDAVQIERKERDARANLRKTVIPLIRDPHSMSDLLSYQLIGGVTAGDDLETEE